MTAITVTPAALQQAAAAAHTLATGVAGLAGIHLTLAHTCRRRLVAASHRRLADEYALEAAAAQLEHQALRREARELEVTP